MQGRREEGGGRREAEEKVVGGWASGQPAPLGGKDRGQRRARRNVDDKDGREQRVQRRRKPSHAPPLAPADLFGVLEGKRARQQRVQYYGARPHVGGRAVVRKPGRHLRRHVLPCAHLRGRHERLRRARGEGVREVAQLERGRRLLVGLKKHILRLEVEVRDAAAVHMRDPRQDLPPQLEGSSLVLRPPLLAPFHLLDQVATLAELDDERLHAVFVLDDVAERQHVRVVKALDARSLVCRLLPIERRAVLGEELLDRDGLAVLVRVRQVHGGEAALAQLAHDGVARKRHAHWQGETATGCASFNSVGLCFRGRPPRSAPNGQKGGEVRDRAHARRGHVRQGQVRGEHGNQRARRDQDPRQGEDPEAEHGRADQEGDRGHEDGEAEARGEPAGGARVEDQNLHRARARHGR